ncbi:MULTISPECIES: hypothetical protein [Nostoc]|uniref:Conjugal transfer protein TrbJ n=2 Tax=Nostoc TaxID=1177 RepID=A0ABR8ILH1_9NOSO|nr:MULTISPECIES: hypothetical protein [Nostoc]MBD2511432.1 hypothetical protein [Desmonostoc muscorum FACHB-395]MBD2565402.1 hypothetical protein [Nostoc linckia FACHB-391]MBD2651160.1 hypothetical protein [Nostoc foliaceum FACHB-393]QHG20868.1 hypothetical protein GJB62_33890 [Nostoc sp. ATCC 53789]
MKNFNQLIVISGVVVQIYFSSIPANAANVESSNNSNQSFLLQFQEIYNSLQTYINSYQKEFTKAVGKLEAELNQAIQSSVGDLGIPDPLKAGKNIEEVLQQQETQLLVLDPRIQAQDAIREWNQQYTRGQSQSVLGGEGQRVQAQEAQITNDAISQSSDNADAAQQDVITQDILKKMAVQNLQTAVVSKSIHAEAQKQSRSLAAANINLADISSRMDEQARLEQQESNAAARQILHSAAVNDAFWENQ